MGNISSPWGVGHIGQNANRIFSITLDCVLSLALLQVIELWSIYAALMKALVPIAFMTVPGLPRLHIDQDEHSSIVNKHIRLR